MPVAVVVTLSTSGSMPMTSMRSSKRDMSIWPCSRALPTISTHFISARSFVDLNVRVGPIWVFLSRSSFVRPFMNSMGNALW